MEVFTKEPNFDEDTKQIKIVDKIGIKFLLDFVIEKDEEISVNVKGTCDGSKGFSLTNNNEGIKTSDYYYTGKIDKGEFNISVKFKVYSTSNYIVIRRPISTINIDNIVLDSIEVSSGENHKVYNSEDEGIFLN